MSKTTRPSNVTLSESVFIIHCTLGEEEEEEDAEQDAEEEDVIVLVSAATGMDEIRRKLIFGIRGHLFKS